MTRKTIHLHIGLHKTGTTSLQNFIFDNAPALLDQGCYVPRTGCAGKTHADLANSLKASSIHLDSAALYAQLADELKGVDARKVVISSECFMEDIPPATIRTAFSVIAADVRILVYLRRQDVWLQSLFNEIVRDPSRRYTGTIMQMRELRKNLPDYSAVLRKWEGAFGIANIVVRPFERAQMPAGLYRDFVAALGLTFDDSFQIPASDSETNKGFPETLVRALTKLNKIPMAREMYRRLITCFAELSALPEFARLDSSYMFFDERARLDLMERFEEGNRRIARDYLKREDGRLFLEPVSGLESQSPLGFELSPQIEKSIFDRLPRDIQEHFIRFLPRLGRAEPARPFFPEVSPNEEQRLRDENQRLRVELNWSYAEVEKAKREVHDTFQQQQAAIRQLVADKGAADNEIQKLLGLLHSKSPSKQATG